MSYAGSNGRKGSSAVYPSTPRERSMKSPPGPPIVARKGGCGRVRLIVWCKVCWHQVGPDPAEIWRRDQRSRLARPACLLSLRQP